MKTNLEIVNKITPVIQDRASETGEDIKELIQEELEKEKCHNATDQSMHYGNDEITFLDIIPPELDLDNGEIYDIRSGKTVKEL